MRHRRSTTPTAVLIALVATVAASPAAAQTFYFGEDVHNSEATRATPTNSGAAEAEFLSRLEGVGTETFESRSGSAPLDLTFPGAGTATLSGRGSVVTQGPGTNGVGRYPISGLRYWEVEAGGFAINFSAPVAAFGFYGVDIGDFNSQLFINLVGESGDLGRYQVPHTVGSGASTGGSIFYWGILHESSPFTGVRFEIVGTEDVFAFDDMTIGSVSQVVPPPAVVPEPGTVLLLASGLAGLGLVGLRRRQGLER